MMILSPSGLYSICYFREKKRKTTLIKERTVDDERDTIFRQSSAKGVSKSTEKTEAPKFQELFEGFSIQAGHEQVSRITRLVSAIGSRYIATVTSYPLWTCGGTSTSYHAGPHGTRKRARNSTSYPVSTSRIAGSQKRARASTYPGEKSALALRQRKNWNFNAAPDSALSFRIHSILKRGARAVGHNPSYRQVERFCRLLSAELMQQLHYYMPNLNYKFGPYNEDFKREKDKKSWCYSYRKHGGPTGMSPREYFSVAIQVFRERVSTVIQLAGMGLTLGDPLDLSPLV
ncbi:ribonuclease T2 [Striga asiatica]|uniref:Ribonuclease T2 n=1 Tax=Striga asiatica TaxID=4170 RepID=A0A5A7QH60_STRAF|nr:ribonuclease T2 [Striga asiatica]